jgi:hypothetical protein
MIYHITSQDPEQIRKEIVAWLHSQAISYFNAAKRRTRKRDARDDAVRGYAYADVRDFIAAIKFGPLD